MKTFVALLALLLHLHESGSNTIRSDSWVKTLSPDDFLLGLHGKLPSSSQRCQRDQFQCTPYQRCREQDIISDAPPNALGLRNSFENVNHSDCSREGDVCCTDPLPEEQPQRCQRDRYQCTPYQRCLEDDIIIDAPRNALGPRNSFENVNHSDCSRAGDVCCMDPQPSPIDEPEVTEEPYVPQCGRRNQEGLGLRTIGPMNSEARFGEFPWIATVLREVVPGTPGLVSVGSLVHPQVVLTAAHKVAKLANDSTPLVVRLGEWDPKRKDEPHPYEDISVSTIRIHEKFDPHQLYDDVALLVLKRPVQLQPHIDTLCLPSPDVNYDFADCVVASWGIGTRATSADENMVHQVVLKHVELPHVPRDDCQRALRKTKDLGRHFYLDPSFTCAGGIAGRDACKGDGGAPLACNDPQQPDRWVQLGVVSWGNGCGQDGVPGVYADVRPHLDWIREVTDWL